MQTATKAMQPVLPKPNSSCSKDNKKSLSTIEDKELRKKLRNRQSALAARERKKARMLQLEQTVSKLEIANRRLTQENASYKQIFDASGLRHPVCADHGNNGLTNCQQWQQNQGLHAVGATFGQSTTEISPESQATFNGYLKFEAQPVAVEGNHYTNHGSMPIRKRSVNLPTTQLYASTNAMKIPQKRRKSCPSYPTSCMSKELQWSNQRDSISGNTFTDAKTEFPLHSATFSSQRRLSHYSLPQSPVQTFHGNIQESTTQLQPNGNSSLPPIDDVFVCNSSANESQFSADRSGCSTNFNFFGGENIPTKWEKTDDFHCKEYATLTDCSHHLVDASSKRSTSGFSDSYQHLSGDLQSAIQIPTHTGQIANNHLGYGQVKTYDEIFQWISED